MKASAWAREEKYLALEFAFLQYCRPTGGGGGAGEQDVLKSKLLEARKERILVSELADCGSLLQGQFGGLRQYAGAFEPFSSTSGSWEAATHLFCLMHIYFCPSNIFLVFILK